MRRTLVAIAVVGLLATGCGEAKPDKGVKAEPKATQLEAAYDECDPSDTRLSSIELADGNHSLLIQATTSDMYDDVACLMLELNTPEFIVSEMDNTTAMMGRQHEEDEGLSYDWSYHPDNGLNMVIHED